jgi:uncharacterized membrane protein YoaK (UPF0700 family)
MRGRPPYLRDLLLAGLSVGSGAVDAICWLALGKVFAAFMTGNIVFLGFRLGGAPQPSIVRVVAALAGFAGGAWIGSAMTRGSALRGVWPRRVSRVLAGSVTVQAAFAILWIAVDGRPASGTADVLIAIMGVAMGMQTVAAFALGVRASFTTAATATLVALMSDLSNWALSVRDRVRLLGVLGGLLIGALLGTLLLDHARVIAPVFPFVTVASAVLVAELWFGADGDRDAAAEQTARVRVSVQPHV